MEQNVLICDNCLGFIYEGEEYVENILGGNVCLDCIESSKTKLEFYDRKDVD